jgi:hypothetical protein
VESPRCSREFSIWSGTFPTGNGRQRDTVRAMSAGESAWAVPQADKSLPPRQTNILFRSCDNYLRFVKVDVCLTVNRQAGTCSRGGKPFRNKASTWRCSRKTLPGGFHAVPVWTRPSRQLWAILGGRERAFSRFERAYPPVAAALSIRPSLSVGVATHV